MPIKLWFMLFLISWNVAKFLFFFLFFSEVLRTTVKKIEEKIKTKKKIHFLYLQELAIFLIIMAILECVGAGLIFKTKVLTFIVCGIVILITTVGSIMGIEVAHDVIIYKLQDLIEENYPLIKKKYNIVVMQESIDFYEKGSRNFKAGFKLNHLKKINKVIEFCEYEKKWEYIGKIRKRIKLIKERWFKNES